MMEDLETAAIVRAIASAYDLGEDYTELYKELVRRFGVDEAERLVDQAD